MNKYKPHVVILPEDDANKDIANGFFLEAPYNHNCQILPSCGGWHKVLEKFINGIIPQMNQYPLKVVILLIDFDQKEDRGAYVKNNIPNDLQERVFILGALSEPEQLKKEFGLSGFEAIGEKLAKSCNNDSNEAWLNPLLCHNQCELDRITSTKIFEGDGKKLTTKQIIFNAD